MKYKLKDSKDNKNAKGVVHYRVEGKGPMKKVVLGDATQTQLGHLHAIGHPYIEEVKAAGK